MARRTLVSYGCIRRADSGPCTGCDSSCRRAGAGGCGKRTAPRPRAYAAQDARRPAGDLSGYWTNSTLTPLEQPKGVTEGEFYTQHGLGRDSRRGETGRRTRETGSARDVHYDNEQFAARERPDHGRAEPADIAHRGSPDGRIPPQIPEAVKRNAANRRGQEA